MKTIKGYYYVTTDYAGSTIKQEFEFEVEDDISEDGLNMYLSDGYFDFLSNLDGGWYLNES